MRGNAEGYLRGLNVVTFEAFHEAPLKALICS